MAEPQGIKPESIETIRAHVAGTIDAEARTIERGNVVPVQPGHLAALLECADRLGLRLEGARVADLTARLADAEAVYDRAQHVVAWIEANRIGADDFPANLQPLVSRLNDLSDALGTR